MECRSPLGLQNIFSAPNTQASYDELLKYIRTHDHINIERLINTNHTNLDLFFDPVQETNGTTTTLLKEAVMHGNADMRRLLQTKLYHLCPEKLAELYNLEEARQDKFGLSLPIGANL